MRTAARTRCAGWERWVADGAENPEGRFGVACKEEGVGGREGESHSTHDREAEGMEKRYVGFIEGVEVGGARWVKIGAFYWGVRRWVRCGGGAVEVDCLMVGSLVRGLGQG